MAKTTTLDLIAGVRGGIPECCDFCGQPYSDTRHPEPEEAGAWSCSQCEREYREKLRQDGSDE